MPCIVSWPGRIPAGRATAEMAATMDLYVTLIKAAGGTLPDYPLDGHDLMPLLEGRTEKSPRGCESTTAVFQGVPAGGVQSTPRTSAPSALTMRTGSRRTATLGSSSGSGQYPRPKGRFAPSA